MKNVVGTFHKIQKAYYQYCYQAVEPDGIKMSEMACILSLYNLSLIHILLKIEAVQLLLRRFGLCGSLSTKGAKYSVCLLYTSRCV